MHRSDLKNWNEIKTNDSWSVFKIMGEFVDGYEKMSKIGPCVSIFGSARTNKDDKYYNLTTEIAKNIVNYRNTKKIKNTNELVKIIEKRIIIFRIK